MVRIQVLGTGCPKCKQLMENVEKAVGEMGIEAEIEKVDKIAEIIKFGIMTTPGLAIEGKVRSAGKVLSAEDVKKLLNPVS